jgi:hypothetical protein
MSLRLMEMKRREVGKRWHNWDPRLDQAGEIGALFMPKVFTHRTILARLPHFPWPSFGSSLYLIPTPGLGMNPAPWPLLLHNGNIVVFQTAARKKPKSPKEAITAG